jgi:hypothetical protein
MMSSKDILQAKKLSVSIRLLFKELLNHLYAQAAEAGRYPSPERMIFDELLPLVEVAILADRPLDLRAAQRAMLLAQDVTDLQAMLGIRLYKQLWHDAVDAYFRHRPELKIKKGKRG